MRFNLWIRAKSFAEDHIPLLAAAGVGMAGQQRQQVAALLDFYFLHLMRWNDLNVGHGVGQRFPQVCELHGIAYSQLIYVPEVIRTAPAPVSGNDLDRPLPAALRYLSLPVGRKGAKI